MVEGCTDPLLCTYSLLCSLSSAFFESRLPVVQALDPPNQTRVAPQLERLDLRGNKLSSPAGTMLRGLKVLRKELAVEWE